jgi:hypothetical protein
MFNFALSINHPPDPDKPIMIIPHLLFYGNSYPVENTQSNIKLAGSKHNTDGLY